MENLALVRALVGDTGGAMDLVEELVTVNGDTSWYTLSLDPLWQSLWDEPRFQALEAKLDYQIAPSE